MDKIRHFILIVLLSTVSGCIGAGTHGSIKNYNYVDVTKYRLEKVVHDVIVNSPNIHQDTTRDEYNDDTAYITMRIVYKGQPYDYTFRYYGGKEYWDTSKTSGVFIAYAYNKNREGGSEGNGGVKSSDYKLKRELTEPFEQEFILKIDSALGTKHIEQ